jgi:hypothetical protein
MPPHLPIFKFLKTKLMLKFLKNILQFLKELFLIGQEIQIQLPKKKEIYEKPLKHNRNSNRNLFYAYCKKCRRATKHFKIKTVSIWSDKKQKCLECNRPNRGGSLVLARR